MCGLAETMEPNVVWDRRTEVKVGRVDVVVEDRVEGELEKAVLNKVWRCVG